MKHKINMGMGSLVLVMALGAHATTLQDAFKEGTFNGKLSVYTQAQDNKGSDDSGFSLWSLGLGYESAFFHGFKVNVGTLGNQDFSQKHQGDYSTETSAIFHTANLSYSHHYFDLILGRQEIDAEWVGDYQEAYMGLIKPWPEVEILVGHVSKKAVIDSEPGKEIEKFHNINGDKGVNMINVRYSGIAYLALHGYFYQAEDVANWYGIRADYDRGIYGISGEYAKSDEEDSNIANGAIYALEARGNYKDFGLALGYIKTDSKGGIGSMDMMGDTISPFEDGNYVYDPDARTTYLSLSYAYRAMTLSGIYGVSKYGTNKERELDIGLEYQINKALQATLFWIDVDAQVKQDDYNRVRFEIAYNF